MKRKLLKAGTVVSISAAAYPGFEPSLQRGVVWRDSEAIVGEEEYFSGVVKIATNPQNVFPKQLCGTFWLANDRKSDIITPIVSHAKNSNFKIGFTCGAMDILHAGHTMMLQDAKSKCDYLIVGVQSDPSIDRPEKNKPVMSYEERLIITLGSRFVDDIICYDTETDLLNILNVLKPDIRIIGIDHQDKKFTGYDLDIPTYFNAREHKWSSSNLRERIHGAEIYKNVMGDPNWQNE